MKTLLICPPTRPAVPSLTRRRPLVLTPCLGRTPLEHALTALAESGAKQVTILAVDQPARIREIVGKGEAWGLQVEVSPETSELSVEQARAKFPDATNVVKLDELPQLPGRALWSGYRGWFEALLQFVPKALALRIGMREVRPQVWIGLRSRVAPGAKLTAPVWIGDNVWVGAHAKIGPRAIVEDDCFVDEGATVTDSVVGPKTYVGAMTEVRDSFAWGADLLNLTTGSVVEVPDKFLLGETGTPTIAPVVSLPSRLLAALAGVATSPLVLVGWLRNLGAREPLFARREFVRGGALGGRGTATFAELNGFRGVCRRWPQLWSVAHGEFAWAGNRPLSPKQTTELATDFEKLWLAAPTGMFSLADAMGCGEAFDDEARAHASFFAVDPSPQKGARVLWKVFCGAACCQNH